MREARVGKSVAASRERGAAGRGWRWVTVGLLGFVLQLVTLVVFARALAMPYPAATVAAVLTAIVHNFVWHERWTWGDHPPRDLRHRVDRFGRFVGLTTLLSVGGNVALTATLVELAGLPLLMANFVAVVTLSVVTFSASARFVFSAPTRHAGIVALALLLSAASAVAAELSADTVRAWDAYVHAVEARFTAERTRSGPRPARSQLTRLERGEIFVEGGARIPEVEIAGGRVHHWRGAVFAANVTLDEVLAELQSPDGSRHVQDDVLEWRLLEGGGANARVFLKLVRREIVTVTYNTEHHVRYERLGPDTATSRSVAVKIAELEDANTAGEREKPAGRDRGFLWRLNSYWRYEQVTGGVIIDLESVTLSREVPALLRPIAAPIIDRIARESMVRTLDSVRRRMVRVVRERGMADGRRAAACAR